MCCFNSLFVTICWSSHWKHTGGECYVKKASVPRGLCNRYPSSTGSPGLLNEALQTGRQAQENQSHGLQAGRRTSRAGRAGLCVWEEAPIPASLLAAGGSWRSLLFLASGPAAWTPWQTPVNPWTPDELPCATLPACCVVTHCCWELCVSQLVKNPPESRRPRFDSWVRKILWRRDRLPTPVFLVFPGGSDGKESACSAGDLGSIPGLGRSPGEGKGNPLQYSGLESSMDSIIHGVAKNGTRQSNVHFLSLVTALEVAGSFTHILFSLLVLICTFSLSQTITIRITAFPDFRGSFQ